MENFAVDNSAINEEIKRLERKLKDVKVKRRNTKDAQDNLEEFVIKLDKQAKEIDRSLNGTIKNIESRLVNINPKSRFKDNYLAVAKTKIFNADTNNVLQEVRDAIRKTKGKILSLDDDISVYDGKISELENEIRLLRQKLK